MCKVESKSEGQRTCAGSCSGRCETAGLATLEQLKEALSTLSARESGLADATLPPAVREALNVVLTAATVSVKLHAAPGNSLTSPIVLRRMKTRADEGPISGKAVTARMMEICGCAGQYDCDCASVENMARRELWCLHNTGAEDPGRFADRAGHDTARR